MGSADHGWLSIAFTVAVIVNIVAVVPGKYSSRLGLLAVFPLALLLLSGLYFVRGAVCHQVGQRATHRLNMRPAHPFAFSAKGWDSAA
jgi:hypothetical protein